MAASRGGAEVRRFMARLPGQFERNVLRGAARAAAIVVADEAKRRSISSEVADAVTVPPAKVEDGRVVAKVQVKGPGAYIAPWLEYGTDPHFITVDESQRRGMSVRKINQSRKAGSIVINGQFVGTTVYHPGARPHPFLRPALDDKERDAIAAAQAHIARKIASGRIVGGEEGEA